MRSQDNLGHFTKGISILLSKRLQKDAKEIEMKLKSEVRDRLEECFHHNLYASYSPLTGANKQIKSENDYAKKYGGHRKAPAYSHGQEGKR